MIKFINLYFSMVGFFLTSIAFIQDGGLNEIELYYKINIIYGSIISGLSFYLVSSGGYNFNYFVRVNMVIVGGFLLAIFCSVLYFILSSDGLAFFAALLIIYITLSASCSYFIQIIEMGYDSIQANSLLKVCFFLLLALVLLFFCNLQKAIIVLSVCYSFCFFILMPKKINFKITTTAKGSFFIIPFAVQAGAIIPVINSVLFDKSNQLMYLITQLMHQLYGYYFLLFDRSYINKFVTKFEFCWVKLFELLFKRSILFFIFFFFIYIVKYSIGMQRLIDFLPNNSLKNVFSYEYIFEYVTISPIIYFAMLVTSIVSRLAIKFNNVPAGIILVIGIVFGSVLYAILLFNYIANFWSVGLSNAAYIAFISASIFYIMKDYCKE